MQLIGAGINKAKDALQTRRRRLAREEVQRELAAFCAATPGACPDGGPAPP